MAARTPPERLALVEHRQLDGAAAPVRRVYLPKPGTREQRPFGRPIIGDRGTQSLVKRGLEAEGEARCAPTSDGVRPGRHRWEAIGALSVQINQQPTGVLDADLATCVARLDHDALLRQLNAPPTLSRPIQSGLKAGV
jgi:RNA-directed DNA polymerase